MKKSIMVAMLGLAVSAGVALAEDDSNDNGEVTSSISGESNSDKSTSGDKALDAAKKKATDACDSSTKILEKAEEHLKETLAKIATHKEVVEKASGSISSAQNKADVESAKKDCSKAASSFKKYGSHHKARG